MVLLMNKQNSKIEHCFKILIYLHKHGITKCKEFAKMFDVDEKQIRRYVYALRSAGIEINQKSGRDGGFYLNDNECPLCKKFLE